MQVGGWWELFGVGPDYKEAIGIPYKVPFIGGGNNWVCSPSFERMSGIPGKYSLSLFNESIGLF